MMYDATLNGTPVVVSLDAGATHAFMSQKAATQCGLKLSASDVESVELGDGSVAQISGSTSGVLSVDGYQSEENVYVLDMPEDVDGKPLVVIGRQWLEIDNPRVDWHTNCVHITRADGSKWILKPRHYVKSPKPVSIKKISFKKMSSMVKKGHCELFAVRVRSDLKNMNVSEQFTDIVEEFSDIFLDELPDQLPPWRDVNFEFNLRSDHPPPVRPVIRLSPEELKELKKQLQVLLDKGMLRPSSSPYGAPVFFVKKKDGDLRMVCDYRALNKITIPDSNPLPLINEALDQVSGATIFSQIDLIGAFHQMRIREEDCPKTAIRTRFGSFEWRVLCFGLTNAPPSFTRLLSTLLRELNGDCLVLFLDDVLVYSRSVEEHRKHLQRLFEILRREKLYAKRKKCNIGVAEVDFLGFRINADGVTMQNRLVDAILEWPTPRTVKDVQSLVGLANFYHRFIGQCASIMQPITDILRNKAFTRGEAQEEAFKNIKSALTTAPVLVHPSSEKEFVVSTDASKYAVGATLQQDGHPVAFLSHRLSDAEVRWDTGDQELLAFMIALREWSTYLRGRKFTFQTDHEPIRYLQSKPRLTGRQFRWLDTLQEHVYEVKHIPGHKHTAPDALSRRPDHLPAPSRKAISLHDPSFPNRIKKGYEDDEWAKELQAILRDGDECSNQKACIQKGNYSYADGFLCWIGSGPSRVYFPDTDGLRLEITKYFHDTGHLGIDKVYNACTRQAFWPKMYEEIYRYINGCRDCQANKKPNTLPAGVLQPLTVPSRCWEIVTADFLTELPETETGLDAVLVIVEKLSKRGIFCALKKTATAPEVAQIFQDKLFSQHGVPAVIISDRDPKFTSHYWGCLTQLTDIQLNMATKDHPQTDGLSENLIRTLSSMLRACIQKVPKQWHKALSEFEFEYNASKNASTGLAPFEVDVGLIPHTPFSRSLAQCSTQSQEAFDDLERRTAYRQLARDNLANARARQKYHADKRRSHVEFDVGDLVMLNIESLDIAKRADIPKKWCTKYLGPFSVKEKKGPVTYKIELPPTMKRSHNVFHLSKLKRYHPPVGQDGPTTVVIDADGTTEQVVIGILDKKRERRRVYYLVQFEGQPTSEAIWMHKSELKNCWDLVRQYEASRNQ